MQEHTHGPSTPTRVPGQMSKAGMHPRTDGLPTTHPFLPPAEAGPNRPTLQALNNQNIKSLNQ